MQNINLYQPERQRSGGPRPWHMLAGLAVVLLVMLSHGLWAGWQLHRGTQMVVEAERQAQALETQLAARQASFREPQLDPRLPEQLAALEAGNRQMQRLATYLQQLDTERSEGFVPLLAGLAERHLPSGLWLTHIRLRDGGTVLGLEGLSQRQELLPQYLNSLGQDAAFQGREFARFEVRREDNGLLRFQLASQPDEEGSHD